MFGTKSVSPYCILIALAVHVPGLVGKTPQNPHSTQAFILKENLLQGDRTINLGLDWCCRY